MRKNSFRPPIREKIHRFPIAIFDGCLNAGSRVEVEPWKVHEGEDEGEKVPEEV
jgi:hypothetical protein